MVRFLIEFDDFPQEKAIVGELLLAYGELEFELARLLTTTFNQDADVAARTLFRIRGEAARIDVADAILRPGFNKIGLGGAWGNAIGAMRHCKNIRNQYAHCHWWHDKGQQLHFMNLDADSVSPDGEMQVTFFPIDLPVLQAQKKYFQYALDWLYYLDDEQRLRLGLSSSHDRVAPKSIPQPPMNSHQTKPPQKREGETS